MKDIFGGAGTVIASLGLHNSIARDSMDRRKAMLARDFKARNKSLRLDMLSQQELKLDNIQLGMARDSKTRSRSLVDKISCDQAMKIIRPKWDFRSRFWLSDYEEKTIADFLDSPWFSRVWVVQEVAVARKLVVICGDEDAEGQCFKKLCSRI
jgi:hypothetical protein